MTATEEQKALAKKAHDAVSGAVGQMLASWGGTDKDRDRFAATAMSIALKDPALAKCSTMSKLVALNECCRLGLVPDKYRGHVYLVPFGQNCTLIPGYRGYIELARRSGMITKVEANVVHQNDAFTFAQGTQPILQHQPWFMNGQSEPGPIVAFWCLAKLRDGEVQIEVMHKSEVDAIRGRSRAKNSGPWVTDYEMMGRKTVIRRAARLWPNDDALARFIGIDDAADHGQNQVSEQADVPRGTTQPAGTFGFTDGETQTPEDAQSPGSGGTKEGSVPEQADPD